MGLQDEIQNRLVADAESILEESIDSVENFFQLHEDGSINLSADVRKLSSEDQILVYLIAERYAYEGGMSDSPSLGNSFFYDRLNLNKSTIRGYLKDLRDERFVKGTDNGQEIVTENISRSIDRIKDDIE